MADSNFTRGANLAGAVDLSSFARKNEPVASAGAGQGVVDGAVKVPSLVLEASQETLAGFVKISNSLPILVNFATTRNETSASLTKKLSDEVIRRNGAMVLLVIDGDSNPQLLDMFQIQSLPAVAAVLKGSPAPLFVGDQEVAAISQILDKVVELGRSNGLTAVAQVDEDAAPPTLTLPPRIQAAYNAVDAGDYELAVKEFEAALAEAPADQLAITGLAQAKFLVRSSDLSMEEVLTKPAETLQDVLNKSDALMAMGHFDKAFDAVLDTFAVADKEDRETLRTHLLELFKIAGDANELVAIARRRLASLLY
jgi:putative thioredoxin